MYAAHDAMYVGHDIMYGAHDTMYAVHDTMNVAYNKRRIYGHMVVKNKLLLCSARYYVCV